jgi:hypothetical protein
VSGKPDHLLFLAKAFYVTMLYSMSTCLSFSDILATGAPRIESLRRVSEQYPDSNAPGACEKFSKEVRLLESCLTETYGMAILFSKKSDHPSEVVHVWELMTGFCTEILHALSGLRKQYPYCGAPELHDLALDYKLACDRRHQNILEEITCQTQMPKGLFPETI